jgi:hypothetical protein
MHELPVQSKLVKYSQPNSIFDNRRVSIGSLPGLSARRFSVLDHSPTTSQSIDRKHDVPISLATTFIPKSSLKLNSKLKAAVSHSSLIPPRNTRTGITPAKYKVDVKRPELLLKIETYLKVESANAMTDYAQFRIYRDVFDMFISGTDLLFLLDKKNLRRTDRCYLTSSKFTTSTF